MEIVLITAGEIALFLFACYLIDLWSRWDHERKVDAMIASWEKRNQKYEDERPAPLFQFSDNPDIFVERMNLHLRKIDVTSSE